MHGESSFGTPTSRDPCKQSPTKTTCIPWVLWMHQHSRPVEARMASHYIHTCGGQLWHQICWQRACRPPCVIHKNKIQSCQRFIRQSVLWCTTKMGLKCMHTWHLHDRIRSEAAPKVQTRRLPSCPQHCPYSPEPKKYGSEAQPPLSLDMRCKLSNTK